MWYFQYAYKTFSALSYDQISTQHQTSKHIIIVSPTGVKIKQNSWNNWSFVFKMPSHTRHGTKIAISGSVAQTTGLMSLADRGPIEVVLCAWLNKTGLVREV